MARLTSAYGYLMFANGAGALMGPPIAGLLFDVTQSYDAGFYRCIAINRYGSAVAEGRLSVSAATRREAASEIVAFIVALPAQLAIIMTLLFS